MKKMTFAEWEAEGEKLFGKDYKEWKFKCVSCRHVQSYSSIKKNNPHLLDIPDWLFMSCEGRVNEKVGCKWTLGGLFQIHKVEVEKEGKIFPVFEFAI